MNAVLEQPTLAPAWRTALLRLGGLWLVILLVYGDTFRSMVAIWSRSDTFAHAFLVAPISAWLVWRQRDRLRALTPGLLPWVAAPMAVAASCWLLGEVAGANVLTQFSATALFVLAVPAMLGRQVARAAAFPLLFLFFMVPAGEFLTPLMMEWTADFTVYAVALSGVPVYREGQHFIIPSGSWSVVEACSGVRYLIASLMVGTLFSYLNFRTLKRRLIFCGVALLTPIVANWVRAYMIVMIGHLSGNTLAVGADHLIYGWVFFGVVILLMFTIGARWAEPAAPVVAAVSPRPAATAAGGAGLWLAAVLALLVVAPQFVARQVLDAGAPAPVALGLPALAGAADVPAAGAEPPLRPVFEGASAQAWRTYRVDGGDVTLYIAYYRHQGYGRKLVSSENVLVRTKDALWRNMMVGRHEVPVAGTPLRFTTTELLGPEAAGAAERPRLDVRQIYWAGGRWTDNDQAAALWGALARLSGQTDDGAALTLYTRGSDAAATRARLDRFTQQYLGTIESHLAAVRAAR